MTRQDPDRSPLGGWTAIGDRDGRRVRLDVEHPRMRVVLEDDEHGEVGSLSLPYPGHGYGGHELVLSPDGRHLVLWLYSGQSEVSYELFRVRPALEHVASFPHARGVGYGPVFAPDGRRLALSWATRSGLRLDDQELDDDGLTVAECVVEWARVHLRELDDPGADDADRTCIVDVRIAAGLPFEGDDSYYPEHLEVSAEEVRFETTWGATVRIPIPLPDRIVVPGPTRR